MHTIHLVPVFFRIVSNYRTTTTTKIQYGIVFLFPLFLNWSDCRCLYLWGRQDKRTSNQNQNQYHHTVKVWNNSQYTSYWKRKSNEGIQIFVHSFLPRFFCTLSSSHRKSVTQNEGNEQFTIHDQCLFNTVTFTGR